MTSKNTALVEIIHEFGRRYVAEYNNKLSHAPVVEKDEDWPSPCINGEFSEELNTWQPSATEETMTFENVEQALDIELHQDVKDYYSGEILQSRFNHSFSNKLTMRTKVQYSGFSDTWFIEPMVTYQPNAFSALYVGINDLLRSEDSMFSGLKESQRQYFIKFQYLF